MAKSIYVGNLSYDTTESALRDLFAQVGEVEEVRLVTDQYSGRSKGFAFVEMADDSTVATAIERYNGTELDGRTLKVDEARPRRSRDNGFGGGRRSSGGYGNSRW